MIRYVISTLACMALVSQLYSQGCSDAGLCRLPSLMAQQNPDISDNRFQLNVGASIGAGDQNTVAADGEVGLNFNLSSTFFLDSKITYGWRSGNGISESGLADFYFSLSYKPTSKWTITSGFKLPFSEADARFNENNLPMDYQPGLGTQDVFGGIAYQNEKWLLAAGLQQPVVQNKNAFTPIPWPENSPLKNFISTVDYQRKGDLVIRAARILRPSDKLTITAGLLPIIHLGEDEQRDDDLVVPIEGSSGLTLNATGHFDYRLGENSSMMMRIGFPLIVREVRPDGLTRAFALNVGYSLQF